LWCVYVAKPSTLEQDETGQTMITNKRLAAVKLATESANATAPQLDDWRVLNAVDSADSWAENLSAHLTKLTEALYCLGEPAGGGSIEEYDDEGNYERACVAAMHIQEAMRFMRADLSEAVAITKASCDALPASAVAAELARTLHAWSRAS
jgi:hypothetical protein